MKRFFMCVCFFFIGTAFWKVVFHNRIWLKDSFFSSTTFWWHWECLQRNSGDLKVMLARRKLISSLSCIHVGNLIFAPTHDKMKYYIFIIISHMKNNLRINRLGKMVYPFFLFLLHRFMFKIWTFREKNYLILFGLPSS